MGAEAPKAPSIELGNFILIQVANIPPYEPPNATAGLSPPKESLYSYKNIL